MTKVFSAHATSVDGYITGPDPSLARALGIGGEQLFGAAMTVLGIDMAARDLPAR